MQVDTTGLKLADSDMLVVLLKSLPETVKNYVSTTAAQTITSLTGTLRLSSLEGNVEHHSLDAELVDAVEGRCGKCGSRKHTAPGCTAGEQDSVF